MARVTRVGSIIQVGADLRVEEGPRLIVATATEELLHDAQTASHIKVGKRPGDGGPLLDALGKPIALGKEIAYLDYGGSDAAAASAGVEANPGSRCFYIYQRRALTDADKFDPETGIKIHDADEVWDEIGTRATEEAAIDFAQRKAGKE